MGEGPERGRVKIGMYSVSFLKLICCLVYLSVHWHTYPLCSGHGVCSSLQFTAEAFSRSRPCGGHLLVQSTWTAPGSSALHQSHRWDCAAPSVLLVCTCATSWAEISACLQTSGRLAAFLRSCWRLSPYSTVARRISRPVTLTIMTSWTASLMSWASLPVSLDWPDLKHAWNDLPDFPQYFY